MECNDGLQETGKVSVEWSQNNTGRPDWLYLKVPCTINQTRVTRAFSRRRSETIAGSTTPPRVKRSGGQPNNKGH